MTSRDRGTMGWIMGTALLAAWPLYSLAGQMVSYSPPPRCSEDVGSITVGTLLTEMVDQSRLVRLPDPDYTTGQFSSYDRASKSPKEDWFANGDRGNYLRVEQVDDRQEYVMMDAEGPGAVLRIWSANPVGVVRIYIDDNPEPVLVELMDHLLGGMVTGLPTPIAGERAKGWNLYFPIPYAKHCKITCDQGDFYYLVNYRTYEPGTRVTSFQRGDLKRYAAKTYDIAARLVNPRPGIDPPADRTKKPFDVNLAPNQRQTLWTMAGEKAICGFLVRLDAEDIEKAARGIVLYMTFDGEQTVECPLGDFYGTAPGLNSYASVPLGITDDDTPDLWCHWWMPFAKTAKIEVKNFTDATAHVHGAVAVVPFEWDERTLHFHAGWRIERDIPTRPMTDWTHLECKGKGRFVGGHLHIQNPVRSWWGEGDEKIYVDGEAFPSFFGTGSEDYYGYAWCCPWPFAHAYHSQPRADGPGNYGNVSNNRFHILDDIPFDQSFKFDMENWHHISTKVNRAASSYWYARPDGTDTFEPLTAEDVALDVMGPYKARRVSGAIEGEEMEVLAVTAGQVGHQELGPYDDGFRRWSNNSHIWWRNGKPGATLELAFNAEEAGQRQVVAQMTKARDYAKVRLTINGKPADEVYDLYDPHIVTTGPVTLGTFDIRKGANKLAVEVVGINPAAKKAYMFGLDYLLIK